MWMAGDRAGSREFLQRIGHSAVRPRRELVGMIARSDVDKAMYTDWVTRRSGL